MSTDTARREELVRRLAAVGPLGLCERLGLEARRDGSGFKIEPCPHHGGRNACNLRIGPDGTLQVKCYGCELAGGALDLIAAARSLDVRRDFPRVLEVAAEIVGDGTLDHAPRPPAPRPSKATYPPAGEVERFNGCLSSAWSDTEIRRQLADRAIDPTHATDRRLAFAIVSDARAPRWARYQGRTWLDWGRRLAVPMFDAAGRLVTWHARRLAGPDDGAPKGLTPAGFKIGGTVMADPLGRMLLATGEAPDWWRDRTVIVAEGVPDWLTWATHYGDDESAPAVLGVISGSWSAELAGRIPDGCRVIVRTHDDTAGVKYGLEIVRSLRDRCDVLAPPAVVQAAKEAK